MPPAAAVPPTPHQPFGPGLTVLRRAVGAVLVALALLAGLAAGPAQAQADANVPGEVVVMLAGSAASDTTMQAVAATHRLVVVDRFGERPIWRLRVQRGQTVPAALSALAADPRVRFAERNVEHQTPEGKRNVVWAVGSTADTFATQWGLHAIRLPEAHRTATGAGVRVAVLDTGLDRTHPLFAGRLARDGEGRLLGRDFVDGDGDPSEGGGPGDPGWGHGTHVAGLVALAAPQARLMPVRVLDAAGRGNVWVLAEALMWAVDPDGQPTTDDGAGVINLSLGTTRKTRLLDIAVELVTCSDDDDDEPDDDYSHPGFDADRANCDARGGVVVMAGAGNAGNTTEKQYPAAERAEGALAITASSPSNVLAPFANRGGWVQLAAPGDQITSALPGGQWGVWSGTSMATPLAAGVAALVRQLEPDWKAVDVTKRLLDRSARLCGTRIRQVDARGAVEDEVPPGVPCR